MRLVGFVTLLALGCTTTPSSGELSRRELSDSEQALGGRVLPRVDAEVSCVEETADGWVAWFGYTNHERELVRIPRGPRNRVLPRGRGEPPEVLQPGTHARAFGVALERTPVVAWHLHSRGARLALATRRGPACDDSCSGELDLDGETVRVGEACGVCGEGVVACDGGVARCEGSSTLNACGGCGALDHAPGESCDSDDGERGVLGCDESGALVCRITEESVNVCGGTGPLRADVGSACDHGVYVCGEAGDVICATLIGPKGGVAEAEGLRVEIPTGALTRVWPVAIQRSDRVPPEAAELASVEGWGWALTPHGVAFEVPVRVTFPAFDGAALDAVPSDPPTLFHDTGAEINPLVELSTTEPTTVELSRWSWFVSAYERSCDYDRDTVPRRGSYCSRTFWGWCRETRSCPWVPEPDCNDQNWAISPLRAERCDNAIDDDCDGAIDEHEESTWYADRDGDGYGNEDEPVIACDPGDDFLARAGDCNDEASAISPVGRETCDLVDQDCDGVVDEGARCDDGNPCTADVCGPSGCTSAPVADGVSCSPSGGGDGTGQCLEGQCYLRITQPLPTRYADVAPWDYGGDVASRWWSYVLHEPFDSSLGTLHAVTLETRGIVRYGDRPEPDEIRVRIAFPDRYALVGDESAVVDGSTWSWQSTYRASSLEGWDEPTTWGYYVETTARTTSYEFVHLAELTYWYLPSACGSDSDCDDGTGCTEPRCRQGWCSRRRLSVDTTCLDARGVDGRCFDGRCLQSTTHVANTSWSTDGEPFWRYQSYEPFEPTRGQLFGVFLRQRIEGSGTPDATLGTRTRFIDVDYPLAASYRFSDLPLTIDRVDRLEPNIGWPRSWSTPSDWGFYFETRASDEAPYAISQSMEYTYYYRPR